MKSKRKIEDQVQQILERGLFLAQYSKKYKGLYDKKKLESKRKLFYSPNRTMIVVQNTLYTQEALLLLESLFSDRNDETCFMVLLKGKHKSKEYKDFMEIKKEYLVTPIKKFRNKIIAHKDSKNVGDPITAFLNPYADELLDKIIYFYTTLNTYLHKHFNTITNNLFESTYQKSFDYLYEMLEKDGE